MDSQINNFIRMKLILTLLIALTLTGFIAHPVMDIESRADVEIVGQWTGVLTVPTGATLNIAFNITRGEDEVLKTSMDSPDQGAYGIETGSTSFEENVLTITVPIIAGGYVGTWKEEGKFIDGIWTQGGGEFELDLRRVVEELDG